MKKNIEVMCCYARQDQLLLLELLKHLKPLELQGTITLWSDININAGAEWEREIHAHLNSAHIFLLLISPDFISSTYCYSREMQRALGRHVSGDALVIPIILRPIYWQETPFSELQALPTNAIPVTSEKWHDRDAAFFDITRGIKKILNEKIPDGSNPSPSSPVPIDTRRRVILGLAGLMMIGGIGSGILWLEQGRLQPVPSTLTPTTIPLGKLLYTYRKHDDAVNAVAWSPNGSRIASTGSDTTVQVWDAVNGGNAFTYRGHTAPMGEVAWSPDGSRIASAGKDNTVQVWDASDGKNAFTYRGHSDLVRAVAWSSDGNRIASGSFDGTVQVWDASDGQHVFTYLGHSDNIVEDTAWSPNGKRIASSGGNPDFSVQIWDAANGANVIRTKFSTIIRSLAWSHDSRRIAAGGFNGIVYVYNADENRNIFVRQGHGGTVNMIAWSPDNRRIASASNDGTVQVWDAIDGGNLFTYREHSAAVGAVAWSPDGRRIASGGDRTVQIWGAG